MGIRGDSITGIRGDGSMGIHGEDIMGIRGEDLMGIRGEDLMGIRGDGIMGIGGRENGDQKGNGDGNNSDGSDSSLEDPDSELEGDIIKAQIKVFGTHDSFYAYVPQDATVRDLKVCIYSSRAIKPKNITIMYGMNIIEDFVQVCVFLKSEFNYFIMKADGKGGAQKTIKKDTKQEKMTKHYSKLTEIAAGIGIIEESNVVKASEQALMGFMTMLSEKGGGEVLKTMIAGMSVEDLNKAKDEIGSMKGNFDWKTSSVAYLFFGSVGKQIKEQATTISKIENAFGEFLKTIVVGIYYSEGAGMVKLSGLRDDLKIELAAREKHSASV
jgi:hypothetical protein